MLEKVLNFIVENYKMILLILYFIVNIIITMVCKSKDKGKVLCALLQYLPKLIIDAELTGKKGSEKYAQVFSSAVEYIASLTGLNQSKVCAKYANLIDSAIENILAAPAKKGTSK